MPDQPTARAGYRWELLVWLWFAFFLNQADRQVYSVVLPQLRGELGLTDVQAGLIATLFSLALAVSVPFAGWAGDRFDLKRIIIVSLAGWRLSTLVSGFATGMLFLIAVRSLATGAGEALYAPAAYALMGRYHRETRSRAMSIHQTALYVGIVCSGFVAGWIADHYGWRAAFWVFGGAGLIIALLAAMRLENARPAAHREQPPVGQVVRRLAATPTALLLAAGFGCLVFVVVGYLTWMPTFLHERFHLSLAEAGFHSMFWHHLLAFAGVAVGGWAADKLALRRPRRRLDVQAVGLVGGAPFLFLVGSLDTLAAVLATLAVFGIFRGIYDCGSFATLFEVVEPEHHATACGLLIALGHGFGSLAPVVLGFVKQRVGLETGFSILAALYLFGAVCLWMAGALFFERDYARAHPLAESKPVTA